MVSFPKTIFVFLTLFISASAYSVPATVPRSVRELIQTVHLFHPSVDAQLSASEQRLKLLNRELIRQKTRSRLLTASLKSSLINSDLRVEESRSACSAVRNYNRSVIECNRLPVVEETTENLTRVCNGANDPAACFTDRLVGYQVLQAIFEFRCREVAKQDMTISTTTKICDTLRERMKERLAIKTSKNPVLMELKGVLIGLNILKREIKMVVEQIEAFTPPETPSPEPEFSPYFVVDI